MLSAVCFFVAFVVVARSFRRRAPLSARGRALSRVAGVVLLVVGALALPPGIILAKAVGRALLPLGLFWLALLLLTALRLVVDDRRGALRAGAAAIAVTILGNEYVGEAMCAFLERDYRGDPFAEAPFDAVVVLGGGAQLAPYADNFEVGPGGDRIVLGARLYRAGKTSLLVTTGSPIAEFRIQVDSLAATRRLWQDLGVPAEAIIGVPGTRNTREEAARTAELIRARGWRRVGLVSSAWHLRRAVALFRRAGVDVVPLGADHRGTPSWEGLYSLVPVGAGAWLQQKAAWELLGAAVHR